MCLLRIAVGVSLLSFMLLTQAAAADRMITVDEGGLQATKEVVAFLETLGARVKVVVPPHFVIADIPADAEGRVLMTRGISAVYGEKLEPAGFRRFGPSARHVVAAWNNVYMGESHRAGLDEAPSPDRLPLVNDVLYKGGTGLLMKPPGARIFDTSEFMLGTVVLAVVLAESDGSIDPESEDWTQDEKDNVTSEIINGLNWYATKAKWRPLTFYTVFEYDVPTGYEPITHPSSEDDLWIRDCLEHLGFAGSRNYVSSLRNDLGADWAVVTYIADSSNDSNNSFSDGLFAYSFLGGPEFVMTYGNDGWGISNMDAVMAHELGHSFYALDEYASAGQACSATSGYLAAGNQNSAYPYAGACDMNSPFCIMRSTSLGSAQVCYWTKGQIGWWDSDEDSICDINDTYPETALYEYAGPCSTFTPAYAGSSWVSYLTNQNPMGQGHEITLNRIERVQYRVDGGGWSEALPNDGAWDGGKEGFHFTTQPLSAGTHIVEARAVQTIGASDTSYAVDTLNVDPTAGVNVAGAGHVLSVTSSPNPFGPRVEIVFSIPGDPGTAVPVSMKVYDVTGREVARLIDEVRSPGRATVSWDGTYANGSTASSGIYFIDLLSGKDRVVRKLVMTR